MLFYVGLESLMKELQKTYCSATSHQKVSGLRISTTGKKSLNPYLDVSSHFIFIDTSLHTL